MVDKLPELNRKTTVKLFLQLFSKQNVSKIDIDAALCDWCTIIGLNTSKLYLELMQIWISASPIPVENVTFAIGCSDKVACATKILDAACEKKDSVDILQIFLSTYDDQSLQVIFVENIDDQYRCIEIFERFFLNFLGCF